MPAHIKHQLAAIALRVASIADHRQITSMSTDNHGRQTLIPVTTDHGIATKIPENGARHSHQKSHLAWVITPAGKLTGVHVYIVGLILASDALWFRINSLCPITSWLATNIG